MVELGELPSLIATGTAALVGWAGKTQIRRIDKLEDAMTKLHTKEDAKRDRDELSHAITGNFRQLDEKVTTILLNMANVAEDKRLHERNP